MPNLIIHCHDEPLLLVLLPWSGVKFPQAVETLELSTDRWIFSATSCPLSSVSLVSILHHVAGSSGERPSTDGVNDTRARCGVTKKSSKICFKSFYKENKLY